MSELTICSNHGPAVPTAPQTNHICIVLYILTAVVIEAATQFLKTPPPRAAVTLDVLRSGFETSNEEVWGD